MLNSCRCAAAPAQGGEEEDGAAPAPAPVFKLPGFGASSSAAADKAQGEGEVVGARAGSEEPSTSGAKEGSHGPDAKRLKTDGAQWVGLGGAVIAWGECTAQVGQPRSYCWQP